MKWATFIVIMCVVTGCKTVERLVFVKKPVPVYIEPPMKKIAPNVIDVDWLKPCPTDTAKEETYDEAKRLAESRRLIIINCDHRDKAKIRAAIENSK